MKTHSCLFQVSLDHGDDPGLIAVKAQAFEDMIQWLGSGSPPIAFYTALKWWWEERLLIYQYEVPEERLPEVIAKADELQVEFYDETADEIDTGGE